MCTSPLHIANRKHELNVYRDPWLLDVPCGHCCECQHAKHLEWFTRSYYEYLDTERYGGSVLYVTLTYAPEHLPTYNGIPCFSRRHIQLFLKRIRKEFGYGKIKYFITSEYGGKTHRPHYHGLIYFQEKVNPYSLKGLVRKCWSYGFVSYGKYGGIVKSAAAISYVSKYVSKDVDFPENPDIPKEVRPFHLQSRGFGLYIIECYNLDNFADPAVFDRLVSGEILVDDVVKGKYSVYIPQYVTRKLLYDVTYNDLAGRKENPVWTLNDVGCAVKRARYEREHAQSVERLTNLYNNLNNIVYDERRMALFNRNVDSHFTTTTEIRSCLDQISIDELAHYAALYKNVAYVPADAGIDLTSVCDNLLMFDTNSISYLLDVKFGFRTPEPLLLAQLVKCKDMYSYKYEFALQIYNALNYVRGLMAAEVEMKERELYSQLKYFKVYA